MEIFKPDVKKIFPGDEKPEDPTEERYFDELGEHDDFYKYSHGLGHGQHGEFTVCGVACEVWGYTMVIPRKRITCPACLRIIRHCRTYKL